MKKVFLALTITAAATGLTSVIHAHEGAHGPEQKVAPHGGTLRDSATLMLELVKEGSGAKIYALEHDGKALDPKLLSLDTKKTSLVDAKKKAVKFTLEPSEGALLLKFEAGSSHRYSFHLVAKFEGKENSANWQIELGGE